MVVSLNVVVGAKLKLSWSLCSAQRCTCRGGAAEFSFLGGEGGFMTLCGAPQALCSLHSYFLLVPVRDFFWLRIKSRVERASVQRCLGEGSSHCRRHEVFVCRQAQSQSDWAG